MAKLSAVAERSIDASAKRVYQAIRDYQNEHRLYLPPAFSDYEVIEGGIGAGTVVSMKMKLLGRTQGLSLQVAEPEPGHMLTESNMLSEAVFTYTVTANHQRCGVRLEGAWQASSGLIGVIERLIAPTAMRRVVEDLLRRLDEYVRANP